MAPPRSPEQRRQDALEKLSAQPADCWVASAASSGRPHLVPLSFAWDGRTITLAMETAALTARNLAASRRARLALGSSRDVVMIDATLTATIPVDQEAADLAERYLAQAGWDPRRETGAYAYLRLRPERIQVWREVDEIPGRTVMRRGEWLV